VRLTSLVYWPKMVKRLEVPRVAASGRNVPGGARRALAASLDWPRLGHIA
jgi:hypothetical protein